MASFYAVSNHIDATMPASIADAARRLRNGSLTCEALTKSHIAGITHLQPQLNAFITVTEADAITTAVLRDAELQGGHDRGPLHGIPIVLKDNIDTAGVRTTIGSEVFRGRTPRQSAKLVDALSTAGAVMLGKTNMNEFAAGPSGTNKAFGNTHNPWDVSRSPGGSSSGTGAAVAAGLSLGGIGTDTGGSVRIPASWSGVVGIRPTFGRVSCVGIYPRASSLDCPGPIARNVADLAELLTVMIGFDPNDSHSIDAPAEDFRGRLAGDIRGLRLGVIENYSFRDVQSETAVAVHAAVELLASLGAEIVTVQVPLLDGPLDYSAVFNILLYEFDEILGDRFRSTINRELVFGPIVQSDLARSANVTRDTYISSVAKRSRQVEEFCQVFNQVDALLTPTMPMTAPLLTTSFDVFDSGRQFTLPFGYLGLPAVSVPCGFDSHSLPIGLQIIGDRMQEGVILQIASAYEAATIFHKKVPPIFWSGESGIV